MANDLSLTITRRIAAPPERVFDAWINPEMLMRFMCPGPEMDVPEARTDPRTGGRFDILMRAGEREIPHWGIYKEVTPHSRLVFTWQSPFSVEDSTVTLTFEAVDDGTDLTLHHVKFADEEARGNHEMGWTAIVEGLAREIA